MVPQRKHIAISLPIKPTYFDTLGLILGGVWLPLLNFSRCPIECLDTYIEY